MKQFDFVKYILNRESSNYLKYFEFELLNYCYRTQNQIHELNNQQFNLKKLIKKHVAPYVFRLTNFKNDTKSSNLIISNSYFTINKELRKLGYAVAKAPWMFSKIGFNFQIYKKSNLLRKYIDHGVKYILKEDFRNLFIDYFSSLKKYYQNINAKALILPSDLPFNEKISVEIFRKLKKPTFIFLHGGIPANYFKYRFNDTDYLMVWGEEHKINYIKEGFEENKIIVTGHPDYQTIPYYDSFRFEFNNILVLTKSSIGGQKTDKIVLQDAANIFLYLYKIEDVLKTIGIRHVRLRLHPSESVSFYKNNINTNFFKFDNQSLKESLLKSDLVIGPGSTVFIEALYYGVNYVIFEPSIDGVGMNNYRSYTPLNGDDPDIPVAHSIDELQYILKSKISVHPKVLNKYIKTPFDLSKIKDIINKF